MGSQKKGRGPKPNQQRKKESLSPSRPCFFKFMFGDFVNKFRVPPAFVKNFKGSNFPTVVGLRSPHVESPVSWRVKMKEKDHGLYITRGWKQIVKDLDLKLADFLIFKLVSEEALHVVVYGPTGCEKKIQIGLKRGREGEADDDRFGGGQVKAEEEEEDEDDDDDECIDIASVDTDEDEGEGEEMVAASRCARPRPCPSASFKNHYPYVVKSLVKHDIHYFCIPLAVAREAEQCTKTSGLLRDYQGQEWTVGIRRRNCNGATRLDISIGWRKFVKDNCLSVGDTLRLEFRGGRGNLIEARVLRRASGQ